MNSDCAETDDGSSSIGQGQTTTSLGCPRTGANHNRLDFSLFKYPLIYVKFSNLKLWLERTGLVVRASDSGSGDPGSILGWVGVLFP